MPGEGALVGVVAARPAALVEVGQAVELRETVGVVLVHDVDLHFAEAPGEGDLAGRRQVQRREDEHLVAQKGLVQAAEKGRVEVACEVDAGDLGAQLGRQRADGERPVLGAGIHGA